MTSSSQSQRWPVLTSGAEDDARVDEASMESFPASDAPSWASGVSRPHASGVLDLSLPPARHGAWKALLAWLEAIALVELFALAVLGAGTALVLVVRLITAIGNWAIGSIS